MLGEDADDAEQKTDAGKRESDRKAVEHEDDHAQEHGRRKNTVFEHQNILEMAPALLERFFVFGVELIEPVQRTDALHQFGYSLKDEEGKARKDDELDGQRMRPPALEETSFCCHESRNTGQLSQAR